jgi:hypothetical protein
MSAEEDHRLIDAWRHGEISDADFATLQARLAEEPRLRKLWCRMAAVEEGLSALAPDTTFQSPGTARQSPRFRLPRNVLGSLAAVVAAALAALLFFKPNSIQSAVPPAMLVDEAGATFQAGKAPKEGFFSKGKYALEAGAVHLRFKSGASVVIEAPAHFDILSDTRTHLHHGKVRAIVPQDVRDFAITTDAAEYKNSGAEFGLRSDSDSAATSLHVFDGRINLHKRGSGEVFATVSEGDSMTYAGGRLEADDSLSAADFVAPGDIGHLRWMARNNAWLQDPSLIALFPFQPTDDRSLLTNARSNSAVTAAKIHGAKWVSGRWQQKDALLFDRDDDFVEIEIPGEFQEFTVAGWFFIDRFDHEMNALLNSNRAENGGLHFQITRTGVARGGVLGVVENRCWPGPPVQTGRWAHLACVVSVPRGIQNIYVNGLVAQEGVIKMGTPIRPGVARIGNWLPSPQYKATCRALRGRIDELAVWSRALDGTEIRSHVKEGRPSIIWSTPLKDPSLKMALRE